MSNRTIQMTGDQTREYTSRDERISGELMRGLLKQAQAIADETGATVEIRTADGIVAGVREPQ